VLPPTALRELEKELKLTLAALGARAEGNAVVDETEPSKSSQPLKKDDCGDRTRMASNGTINGDDGLERKRTESDATIGDDIIETVLTSNGTGDVGVQSLDVDAVVGALGEVGLGDDER
jgi:hypothetical protein